VLPLQPHTPARDTALSIIAGVRETAKQVAPSFPLYCFTNLFHSSSFPTQAQPRAPDRTEEKHIKEKKEDDEENMDRTVEQQMNSEFTQRKAAGEHRNRHVSPFASQHYHE
jgi:hypothetical protein